MYRRRGEPCELREEIMKVREPCEIFDIKLKNLFQDDLIKYRHCGSDDVLQQGI